MVCVPLGDCEPCEGRGLSALAQRACLGAKCGASEQGNAAWPQGAPIRGGRWALKNSLLLTSHPSKVWLEPHLKDP